MQVNSISPINARKNRPKYPRSGFYAEERGALPALTAGAGADEAVTRVVESPAVTLAEGAVSSASIKNLQMLCLSLAER